MSNTSGIKIVMGGGGPFAEKPASDAPQLLSVLKKHGVNNVDSAVIYGDSEEVLGLNSAGDSFVIDTKVPGGLRPGSSTKDAVIGLGHESLAKLKMKQVDVLYIHSPDTETPFEDTLAGIDALHKEGMFRRFGLSNFKTEQVQEVFRVCEAKGFVKPSVYQGNYNAFARSYEVSLLPVLRENGVSFYAYSPQAGGFLSKSSDILDKPKEEGQGRMLSAGPLGDMYRALYAKPTLLEGLKRWNEIAKEAGLQPSDMATRWVRFNSALKNQYGDALIIGGRTVEQADQTLVALEKGPLSDDVAKKIDEVWELIKDDAPVDNYHDFIMKNSMKL